MIRHGYMALMDGALRCAVVGSKNVWIVLEYLIVLMDQ